MEQSTDKKALLNELRLDRDAPQGVSRPGLKSVGAVVAVILVVGLLWVVDFSDNAAVVVVKTTQAQATVSAAQGASVLDATGYVVARRQATVSSKATGKVVEVFIEEGVVVTSGQLLARLDDSIPRARFDLAGSQLSAAEASIAELEVALKKARLDLGRTEGLAQRNLASAADMDRDALNVEALLARLETARREIEVSKRSMAVQRQMLDDMEIRAPFAGVVIAKAAQPGEMISPVSAGGGFTRTGICTIVDMQSLEVEVDVNESYINRVQAGQPVQVTLNAYPQDQYAAEVIAIIPAADRNKATVRVRIGFLSRDARILPDMGVRVAFLAQSTAHEELERAERRTAPAGVRIPQHAIAEDTQGSYVYVVDEDIAEQRRVRLGDRQGSQVVVLTGLRSGERVVAQLSAQMLNDLRDGVTVSMNN